LDDCDTADILKIITPQVFCCPALTAGILRLILRVMAWTLQNKLVWITGASSGIGRAMALEAAQHGARLIISGRNVEALADVAEHCSKSCAIVPFDVADAGARETAVRIVLEKYGCPDVLILNAGVSQRARFEETDEDVFNSILETNFFSAVAMTRMILPAMRRRNSGVIACVSSIAGLMGAPWRTAYAASKHAQSGFFQSLRAELYGSGIQISMVYPGFVRTAISQNALAGNGARHGELDPLQKLGQDPAETAKIVWRKLEQGSLEIRVAFDGKAHLGVFLSRYFPALFAKSISRHGGL